MVAAGRTNEAKEFIEGRLGGRRSLENLLEVVGTFERSDAASGLVSDYRREAHDLARAQIGAGSRVPTPYVAAAKFALEDGSDDEFRAAAGALRSKFPDDRHAHLYYGIGKLKDHDYAEAESALRRAEAAGVPAESIAEYLKLAIDGQKWVWEYAQVVLWTLGAWAAGLLAIYVAGRLLSSLALRSLDDRRSATQAPTRSERRVRATYRALIGMAGVYYYVSLPMVVLLAIALPAAIGYALLLLPTFGLPLILIVLAAGCGGLLTAVTGIRAIFAVKAREEDPGRRIADEEAPRFRTMLREVAERVGTRPIDEVWMVPGAEVAVVERGSYVARMRDRGRRALVVGAAVLDGFRIRPFESVLAHEYGHFLNRDTAGGDVALRVRASMHAFAERIVLRGRIRRWDVGVQFLRLFHGMFTRISLGAGRLQEVLADRVAVAQYGSDAFEEGLSHVVRRTIEFDVRIDNSIGDRLRNISAVVGFYGREGFDIEDRMRIRRTVAQILEAETTDLDTHPSPRDRIAAALRSGSPGTTGPDGMVWDCFLRPNDLRAEMEAQLAESVAAAAAQAREEATRLVAHLTEAYQTTWNPALRLERGRLRASIGEFASAKDDLEAVAKFAADVPEYHVGLAWVHERLGQPDAAAAALRRVRECAPAAGDDCGYLLRLGRLELAADRPADAKSRADRILTLDDRSAEAYLLRGDSLRRMAQHVEAASDYHRALELWPECREAQEAIGSLEAVDAVGTATDRS